MARLLMDMEAEDGGFIRFTQARARFEEFLVSHKMFVNQLTVKHGSMTKGFAPIRDYYKFILDRIHEGKTDEEIEGEIHDGALKSKQASLFQQQLDLAVELRLNVVIHQRNAWEDTLEIMRGYGRQLQGVFHCFGGTRAEAEAAPETVAVAEPTEATTTPAEEGSA